jgi:2-polyprenyl-3-methyl-5-hydroxy-6-metoxy-1,4-benzoquinol methylase
MLHQGRAVTDNLVRDIHDAVAASEDPAQASVRPPHTSARQLRAMRRDVLRKLRLKRDMSVAEIGCGVGLLGVPIAARVARYTGLDFAPQAVRVANERLRAAGVGARAQALCLDVLSVEQQRLRELGRYDRVLLYAVLSCARSEREGICFLQRAVDLLAPGGRALVGNLPLQDLAVDWAPREPPPRGLPARAWAAARWIATPGTAPVALTRRWKLRRALTTALAPRAPVERFVPARLPDGYTVALSTETVERWLAAVEGEVSHHWQLPAPGVPLAAGRADLILLRR